MASLQHIKKRLEGIRGINQMTTAMELVAATKMRRAQEVALSSRPYAITALEILANLTESIASRNENEVMELKRPLLDYRNTIKKTAVLLVASDKGLAGSFNSAVFKQFEKYLLENSAPSAELAYIAVGEKAYNYLHRKNVPIHAKFTKYGDVFRYEEIESLAELLRAGYAEHKWDRVLVFSTHFMSTLRQEVIVRQLLPIEVDKIRASVEEIIPEYGRYADFRKTIVAQRPARPVEYIIEPTREKALDALLPLLFKMQVYHLVLEANASEHSARRIAMKNASDNASELIDALTLQFNRSRQAAITKEIIEITGTAAALQ